MLEIFSTVFDELTFGAFDRGFVGVSTIFHSNNDCRQIFCWSEILLGFLYSKTFILSNLDIIK